MPGQSPLFHALNVMRYDRQSLISAYEEQFGCRLVVMSDEIFPESVTIFEELLYDADCGQDLHLMLNSPGGDGETAIRLVRCAQARCRELSVIVPDQAKSAATLLALGAHNILMGPTSDLGPVDPQFRLMSRTRGMRLVAAKDLLAAYDNAMAAVAENPNSYPIHANLLGEIDAVLLQAARSAMSRTGQQLREALASNPDRNQALVEELAGKLKLPLIDDRSSHGAVLGVNDAQEIGLPVKPMDAGGEQWQMIWRLWTKYFPLVTQRYSIYEGRRVSHVMDPQPNGMQPQT